MGLRQFKVLWLQDTRSPNSVAFMLLMNLHSGRAQWGQLVSALLGINGNICLLLILQFGQSSVGSTHLCSL